MNIPYIINGDGITLFINGRPTVISITDCRYEDTIDAVMSNDNSKLEELANSTESSNIIDNIRKMQRITESYGDLDIIQEEDGTCSVYYKTVRLPECITNKLITLWKEGCTDFSHYYMFCEKLLANPSKNSREQLYTFLSGQNLPITQDGNFIAYKGIREDMVSINGNEETTVLSGERLDGGYIKNNVGDTIRVRVADVESDPDIACGTGLHVGSYSYASNFGKIVVAVEVNPAHVISVPTDCNCQKCRVSEYKVLNIVQVDYTKSSVTVNADATVVEDVTDPRVGQDTIKTLSTADNYNKYTKAIERNIENHYVISRGDIANVYSYKDNQLVTLTDTPYKMHPHTTTIAQLCGSVGRKEGINRSTMLAILLALGFTVVVNEKNFGSSLVTY